MSTMFMPVLSTVTLVYMSCFDTVYDPYVIYDELVIYLFLGIAVKDKQARQLGW